MNQPTANSVLCIAGAHRSGTSMVTRLLHSCGLELGPESEWMPARADNPDGFWEHLRFVELNDEVLNQLGCAWDLPPPRDADFASSALDPWRRKAEELIREFDSSRPWGWKDPRNSLTLPFWRELLPGFRLLAVVRNPLEVAYSMRQRNGTSYSFGLRLWKIYNRRFLESSRQEERIVVHYDAFFKNPLGELKRIARFAGLPLSRLEEAANLVHAHKRHTQFSTEELIEARISPELLELHEKLIAEAQEGSEDNRGPKGTRTTHVRSVTNSSSDSQLLPGAINRLHVEVPDRLTKLHDAENAIKDLKRELARRDGQLLETSISLAGAEGRLAGAEGRLGQQLQATKKLMRFLREIEDASERLRLSRRWKMVNPLAALKAKVSAKPLAGYGHLEKVLTTYSKWRVSHPDVITAIDICPRFHVRTGPRTPTKPVEFESLSEVEVSIVIPVFNQLRFTQGCLSSIQEYQAGEPFEVIVVDDCSTDATSDAVAQIPGVVYLRNESNQGFIASCNRGAENARGQFLVFLNNDTEVTAGWLSALRETFEFEPRAGLVGSKLIYPDGRLQEAGGIVWQDGSAWNRGKFRGPDEPEYDFLRETDYCSAACLMIPKSLFQHVGGFDTKYAPGYYEDTDLAFKVRRDGYKVLYQPASEVIHFEGVTGGTDLSTGAKRHQEINRLIFAERWANVLAQKPVNGDVVSYNKLRPGQKRILVIDHHVPTPDRDSGSVRMCQILRILHRLGHRVSFVPDNVSDIPPYGRDLRKQGIEVVYRPHIKNVRDYLERHGREFDVVILSRCDFAHKHIADVRLYAPNSRVVFDTVDLHSLRTNREAQLTKDTKIELVAREARELEYKLIDQADETWVVSEFEQQLLRKTRPNKKIEVVSNIVDVPGSATPFPLRHDFLFIGSFQHRPNVDAVLFFTKEIYPLIAPRLGGARFYIIGDKRPVEVAELASDRIIVTGLQPDVKTYFDSVKLSIAPLRFGAGVKGKINQSMGFGVPVVATSVAVEGMALTDREDILIADSPNDFAQAVIELYESEELWERISRNGIEKTKSLFSREAAEKQLRRLLSDRHIDSDSRARIRPTHAYVTGNQNGDRQ